MISLFKPHVNLVGLLFEFGEFGAGVAKVKRKLFCCSNVGEETERTKRVKSKREPNDGTKGHGALGVVILFGGHDKESFALGMIGLAEGSQLDRACRAVRHDWGLSHLYRDLFDVSGNEFECTGNGIKFHVPKVSFR